jgi:hypothetical protein
VNKFKSSRICYFVCESDSAYLCNENIRVIKCHKNVRTTLEILLNYIH